MVHYAILRRRQQKVPYEILVVKSNSTKAWMFPHQGSLRYQFPTSWHVKAELIHSNTHSIDQEVESLIFTDIVREGSITVNTTIKLEHNEVTLLSGPPWKPKNPTSNYARWGQNGRYFPFNPDNPSYLSKFDISFCGCFKCCSSDHNSRDKCPYGDNTSRYMMEIFYKESRFISLLSIKGAWAPIK